MRYDAMRFAPPGRLRLVNESLRAAEKETRKQGMAARAAERAAEEAAANCALPPPARNPGTPKPCSFEPGNPATREPWNHETLGP